MARQLKIFPLYPWNGGLNTSVDQIIADPQSLQQADNIIFTNSGSRRKRGGQARFNTTALTAVGGGIANIVHLADYWANVTNTKRPAIVAVTANATATSAARVYRSINWVAGSLANFNTINLRVDAGGVTSTVITEDLIMGFKNNGTTSLRVWFNQTSTANLQVFTATTGTLPARAWIVREHLRRLFLAGDPNNPDLLYASAVGNPQNWGASATQLNIGSEGDGDPSGITAIFPSVGGDSSLYVAKRRSLYRVSNTNDTNPANWKVDIISRSIGCINPNAVVAIDQNEVIFCSDRGVHTLTQVLTTTAVKEGEFLSAPIQYDWNNIIDKAARDRINLTWYQPANSLLMAVKLAADSTMKVIYAYNIEVQQWYRWTSTDCNDLLVRYNGTTGADELYSCTTTGFINKLDQETRSDFGSAIQMTIRTQAIYPDGVPTTEKAFTNLGFVYRSRDSSTFTARYAVDGVAVDTNSYEQLFLGGFILGSSTLGVGILGQLPFGIKPNFQHCKGVGHSIDVTVQHNTNSADCEIFGMFIEYEEAGESQNAFRKI